MLTVTAGLALFEQLVQRGLAQVMPVFSAAALCFGLTTWFLGPWVERAGPRLGLVDDHHVDAAVQCGHRFPPQGGRALRVGKVGRDSPVTAGRSHRSRWASVPKRAT